MTAPERIYQIALTRRELELTAAAIDMTADLMAGGDREKELRPLFDKVIARGAACGADAGGGGVSKARRWTKVKARVIRTEFNRPPDRGLRPCRVTSVVFDGPFRGKEVVDDIADCSCVREGLTVATLVKGASHA